MTIEQLDIVGRLERIEEALSVLIEQRTVKDWYTTDEVAKILGKAEFTVREWCRNGRIRAEKKGSGRGKYQSWVVSHAELLRFQRNGLLPKH
jgi:excisionase family DNA binding protein